MVNFHLYAAGTETTSSALRWALLFMCLHEEVKERVQAEIDNYIGRYKIDDVTLLSVDFISAVSQIENCGCLVRQINYAVRFW